MNMKKFIVLFVVLFVMVLNANAQIMRTEELEKYAKEKYGEKWNEAAANLASTLKLDKNNSLTYVQVIDCPGKTKDELYVILNYWVTASFNDANSVIKLNDKELGCIIAQGYLANIAGHMGGSNSYDVSVKPIIKLDIKDNKVRVTYTVQNYEAIVYAGGGILGAISGTIPSKLAEKWVLEKCYPFIDKDSHKKTSSKALIMTHAFSNVIMDKIEEAVKNGVSGNENDNW
jgi:hypothetical protein